METSSAVFACTSVVCSGYLWKRNRPRKPCADLLRGEGEVDELQQHEEFRGEVRRPIAVAPERHAEHEEPAG